MLGELCQKVAYIQLFVCLVMCKDNVLIQKISLGVEPSLSYRMLSSAAAGDSRPFHLPQFIVRNVILLRFKHQRTHVVGPTAWRWLVMSSAVPWCVCVHVNFTCQSVGQWCCTVFASAQVWVCKTNWWSRVF